MSSDLSMEVTKVDMANYLLDRDDVYACRELADSLRRFGAVLVKDPRVRTDDSDAFLDMMERYFSQPRETKLMDARPQLSYQVGVTPDGIEKPRDNSAIANELEETEKPVSDASGGSKDVKWRYFWRCGERPSKSDFPELNAEQVVPESFKSEWSTTMDTWGTVLFKTISIVSQMLALGLHLPLNTFKEKLEYGPHLLAPTGVDMRKYGSEIGTTLAGYHYDLNMLTVHGRARFPGLFTWTRGGKRVAVEVPPGYLLVQTGVQLEHLTGGYFKKGMHEVVVSEETKLATEKAIADSSAGGDMGVWRVSSTLFGHVRSDTSLKPLRQFATCDPEGFYKDIRAGEQVAEELKTLELAP